MRLQYGMTKKNGERGEHHQNQAPSLQECPVIKFVPYDRKDDLTGTDEESELDKKYINQV